MCFKNQNSWSLKKKCFHVFPVIITCEVPYWFCRIKSLSRGTSVKVCLIRRNIASDLCTAVGCQQFRKVWRKRQRRIIFECNYFFSIIFYFLLIFPSVFLHRAGQRSFELLALIGSPQLLSFWFPRSRPRRTSNFSVMISVVTQRAALVVGIAYGCPYYTGPAIFHFFFKVPQMRNRLFPTKPLPLHKSLRFVQSAKSFIQLGNTTE